MGLEIHQPHRRTVGPCKPEKWRCNLEVYWAVIPLHHRAPTDRDLYIQWIYDINEEGKWLPLGKRGILITTDEISTIEFWPYVPPGDKL